MWIWWIISLIVLIACFIFAYRVIMSSYDFLPGDQKKLLPFKRNPPPENNAAKNELIWELRNKLQKVEESASFYEIQFSKMQQRLRALEEHSAEPVSANLIRGEDSEEEDWKEMYYEENEVKEKLENELDATRQKLEETEKQLSSIEENNSKLAGLQSDYDARLEDLQSMQNQIGLLQRQLEAAAIREKEAEQSLLTEIQMKKHYSQLESNQSRLQSENEELRRQLVEMSQKEQKFETGITRLNELESQLMAYEAEKAKMIADLEKMVIQNKMFSTPKNS